jgi:hypothetical protein
MAAWRKSWTMLSQLIEKTLLMWDIYVPLFRKGLIVPSKFLEIVFFYSGYIST